MMINGAEQDISPFSDLSDADLRGANLREATLRDANLRGADLRGANLRDADLRDADLRGAYLHYADLRDADLRGANLHDADLRGSSIVLGGIDLRGYLFYGWRVEGNNVAVRAGCRYFPTIESARAHWTVRHLDNPMLHADCLSLVNRIAEMAQYLPVLHETEGKESCQATE